MAEPYTFPSKWKAKTDPVGLEKVLKDHARLQRRLRERGLDKPKPMKTAKKAKKVAGPLSKLAKAERTIEGAKHGWGPIGRSMAKSLAKGGTSRAIAKTVAGSALLKPISPAMDIALIAGAAYTGGKALMAAKELREKKAASEHKYGTVEAAARTRRQMARKRDRDKEREKRRALGE